MWMHVWTDFSRYRVLFLYGIPKGPTYLHRSIHISHIGQNHYYREILWNIHLQIPFLVSKMGLTLTPIPGSNILINMVNRLLLSPMVQLLPSYMMLFYITSVFGIHAIYPLCLSISVWLKPWISIIPLIWPNWYHMNFQWSGWVTWCPQHRYYIH